MSLLIAGDRFQFNLQGNRAAYSDVRSVYIDVNRVFERSDLDQLHFVPREASQFKEFNRQRVFPKGFDNAFFAPAEMCYREPQNLI
jgi:hypothetical protein